jgi:hypothetical protein
MVGMTAQDFSFSAYYSTALAYADKPTMPVSTKCIKWVTTICHSYKYVDRKMERTLGQEAEKENVTA